MTDQPIPPWMIGFSKSVKPGSTLDYELVEEFINIREPAAHELDYVQCGANLDEEEEQSRYLTFKRFDGVMRWVYIGKFPRWGGYKEEEVA